VILRGVGKNEAMRRLVGVLLTVLAVAFGLLFLDEFITGITSGNWWRYFDIVVYAAATYGAAIGARKLLTRKTAEPDQ